MRSACRIFKFEERTDEEFRVQLFTLRNGVVLTPCNVNYVVLSNDAYICNFGLSNWLEYIFNDVSSADDACEFSV